MSQKTSCLTIVLHPAIEPSRISAALAPGVVVQVSVSTLVLNGHAMAFLSGIPVTVVEPGYSRTGFLNAGAQIKSEKRIKEYDETAVGQIRAGLDSADNNQLGDVVKSSTIIVDTLTQSGAVKRKKTLTRVALGSDCSTGFRQKFEETTELLDEWDSITSKTNHAQFEDDHDGGVHYIRCVARMEGIGF